MTSRSGWFINNGGKRYWYDPVTNVMVDIGPMNKDGVIDPSLIQSSHIEPTGNYHPAELENIALKAQIGNLEQQIKILEELYSSTVKMANQYAKDVSNLRKELKNLEDSHKKALVAVITQLDEYRKIVNRLGGTRWDPVDEVEDITTTKVVRVIKIGE